MFYSENIPQIVAKPTLVEGRFKITKEQKARLKEIENSLNIPASWIVRMALDTFIPKMRNAGLTETGIRSGYLNGNY